MGLDKGRKSQRAGNGPSCKCLGRGMSAPWAARCFLHVCFEGRGGDGAPLSGSMSSIPLLALCSLSFSLFLSLSSVTVHALLCWCVCASGGTPRGSTSGTIRSVVFAVDSAEERDRWVTELRHLAHGADSCSTPVGSAGEDGVAGARCLTPVAARDTTVAGSAVPCVHWAPKDDCLLVRGVWGAVLRPRVLFARLVSRCCCHSLCVCLSVCLCVGPC